MSEPLNETTYRIIYAGRTSEAMPWPELLSSVNAAVRDWRAMRGPRVRWVGMVERAIRFDS